MANDRALVLSLVEDVEHGGVGGDVGSGGKRLVEGDIAFAVHHHHAVQVHLAGPGAPCGNRREGRHHLQRTRRGDGLVDEGQLVFVHRVGAHPDPVGVEHHLAVGIGVFLAEIFQGHQFIVLDRHVVLSRISFFGARAPLLPSRPRKAGCRVVTGVLLDPRFRGTTACMPCMETPNHYAGVKNGNGAPSVGLNTTFTFWPILSLPSSQSTKLVCSDGPSFSVT